MGEFRIAVNKETGPVFTSNGLRVLFATGSATMVSLLEPESLESKYGAELILDNVRINPYWQVGECNGAIYRLAHFPIDGTDYDYQGIYVFNTVPTEEYKKACADPSIDTIGSRCEIIVNADFFPASWGKTMEEWYFEIPDNLDEVVKEANKPLQAVIDKLKK